MIHLDRIILYLLIYTAEAFIIWWYSSNLFRSRYSKKIECISIFASYCCLYLISFTKLFWANIFSFAVINFIIFILLYKTKWTICLFHSLVTTCIMSLSEIIILGLSDKFNWSILYNVTSLSILAVLSKMLYFVGLRIMIVLIHGSISENRYTNKTTNLMNFIPFISIYIIIVLIAVLLNTDISIFFRYMLSSCAVLLLLINIFIFYVYHCIQEKNREFTELQMQLQKEYDMAKYYKALFVQNENQQILIHDIRNHLMSIARLNDQNESDKISRYLYTLLNSSDLQNSIQVSDNEMLNSILCYYIKLCQDEHIVLKVDVRKKLLKNIDYSDLTALFCNLLDNAITACSNVPDSYIDLNITNKENTDITIINIINTCRIRPIFHKNGIPVSQKKNKLKHGFGLKSVNRIIQKYNGDMKMYFDDEKMSFHTIIMLRCN